MITLELQYRGKKSTVSPQEIEQILRHHWFKDVVTSAEIDPEEGFPEEDEWGEDEQPFVRIDDSRIKDTYSDGSPVLAVTFTIRPITWMGGRSGSPGHTPMPKKGETLVISAQVMRGIAQKAGIQQYFTYKTTIDNLAEHIEKLMAHIANVPDGIIAHPRRMNENIAERLDEVLGLC